MRAVRAAAVRVRNAAAEAVRGVREAAMPMQPEEAGESEVGGREGTDDWAYDGDELLAPRRNADVGEAVHGDAVRETAGVFQG